MPVRIDHPKESPHWGQIDAYSKEARRVYQGFLKGGWQIKVNTLSHSDSHWIGKIRV